MPSHKHKNAWIVSVNMGYGHERAAFGLEDLAYGDIITANAYPGIPASDRKTWSDTRKAYEAISRMKSLPLVGDAIFDGMDYFQRIPSFYPRRDLSHSTIALGIQYRQIRRGLLRHLIEKLSKKRLPFVSTFPMPAFAAEEHGYPGDIYIVTCDADVSRAWAPLDPKKSRIRYFASNGRVVERLKLYGVREEQIFLTGFPLPKSNIGGTDGQTVRKDLSERICNLDPNGIFIQKYDRTLQAELGPALCKFKSSHPLTLTFCVGGAGAQQMLGVDIMKSLRTALLQKRIRLNLEAGTRHVVAQTYLDHAKRLGLGRLLTKQLNIHWYGDRPGYFRAFAKTLRTTDILWTKPSELSFYTGLGIPIIMAPTVGSQEDFNKIWLQTVNGGTPQMDPEYTGEWLFDWINSGGLARFAWSGYIEAPTHGAYRIESILTGEKIPVAELPLIV